MRGCRAGVFDTDLVGRRAFEVTAFGAIQRDRQGRGDDLEFDLLLNLQVAIGLGGDRVDYLAGFLRGQDEIELASFAGP